MTGEVSRGYLRLTRRWQEGDTLTLTLPMPVRRVYGHPQVRQQAGKVALQRSPGLLPWKKPTTAPTCIILPCLPTVNSGFSRVKEFSLIRC